MKLFGAPIGKCLFAFLLLAIIFQLAISSCRAGRQGFFEGEEPDFTTDEPEEDDEGFYEGLDTDEDEDGFQEGFDEGLRGSGMGPSPDGGLAHPTGL